MKQWKLITILMMALLCIGTAMGCKDVYKANIPVIISDVIENEGKGSNCSISIYTDNQVLNQTANMARSGLAYEYNASILDIGIYSAYINCTYHITQFHSECKFAVESGEGNMLIGASIILGLAMALLIFMGYRFYHWEEQNWTFYLSYACWYIALLFPMFGIRMMANAAGISSQMVDLLNMAFRVYLVLYSLLVLMLMVYIIHLVFSWLMWWNNTPVHKRKKLRDDMQ